MTDWHKSDWRAKPRVQMPDYTDDAKLKSVEAKLASYPPLVFAGEARRLKTLLGKVSRGEGTLGKLVNEDELYQDVREGVGRINSITTKIDEGQGTIGRLVNEDDLYRDAKTTLHKVEKTVDGMSDTGPLSALGVVLGTLF